MQPKQVEIFNASKSDLQKLNELKAEFLDQIDRIVKNNGYAITKQEGEEAKKRLHSSIQHITKQDQSRVINEKDWKTIMNLIHSVIKQDKQVLLKVIDGGIGVEEVFSGKIFYFE